jgi:cobalt-precorrin 5A hydrolase
MSAPKPLVAGFGMRAGSGPESLHAALTLAQMQIASRPLTALATIAERAEGLRALADIMNLPLRIVAVSGVQTPTQSARVRAGFGTGSVAEAAALTAAGPNARLVVLRVTSPDGMATCALAEGEGI